MWYRYSMTREASIEEYLKKRVEALDGRAVKLNPLNYLGIPDRLVLLPGGVVGFIELKRPRGGRVDTSQVLWHRWLMDRGFFVAVCPTHGAVDDALLSLRAHGRP